MAWKKNNTTTQKNLQRFLHSTFFSLIVLLILVALLAYIANSITKSYHKEPNFGGMVMLRQADMGLNVTPQNALVLDRDMILEYITSKEVLVPIAMRNGWDVAYEEMVKCIDVKERLSSQNSYIIVANTYNMSRSSKIARALSVAFLENYRKKWNEQGKILLNQSAERIEKLKKELHELAELKVRFQDKEELRPLNTDIEMRAINEQLVEAQNQFMTAYTSYITTLETKRSELQLEYDLARQIYSENNIEIRNMKLKLAELERQSVAVRKKMSEQKPNLYRMTMTPQKLTGLPNDILYFYENVQTLQQLKLALMLNSLIEDKENMLKKEEEKKLTIERLRSSNSCDVFIREVGR